MKPVIHIGFDFNAGNCNAVAALYFLEKNVIHVFKEFVGYFDTPELTKDIRNEFGTHVIYAYPDATGIKRYSTNAHVSDIGLLKTAKFRIRAKHTNPLIRDRIASVNRAFDQEKLKIDINRCPQLTECLEQQVFLNNGLPDKKSGWDHLVEALGYMVYYIMPVRRNHAAQAAVAG